MFDRRKLPRKHILFYSPVFGDPGGELIGYLENISQKGIMVVSEYSFRDGTELRIAIDLPDRQNGERKMSLKIRCIWCRRDSDPQLYNVGFEILEIRPEDRPVLDRLLDPHSVHA